MILAALAGVATAAAIVSPPPIAERTPNLYRPAPPACADIQRRVREDQRETFKQLGQLPWGSAIYAVERKVGGCGVPSPVGYHPPSLPGAADAPPKREDAPSNRR